MGSPSSVAVSRLAPRAPGPSGLRAIMLASPLCDQKAFCTRFHAAVREAWRAWCQSHPLATGATRKA